MKLRLRLLLVSLCVFACSLFAYAAAGAVYTETNLSNGNAVVVFNRTQDGRLFSVNIGAFPTGGRGTGTQLGSQGALAIDDANQFLFAVNAGSDNISVFKIVEQGLVLQGVYSSNGRNPISLTVKHNVLYVLNDGGAVGASDTVAGFAVDDHGNLTSLVSGLHLSAASVGPAEISFNPDGNLLVVTEKGTNNIDVFIVDHNGVASGPTITASAGETPYGFAFGKRNQVFISDAAGGSSGAGAVSSYAALANGILQTITAMSPDNQTAPCWVVLTADGGYAYTTNTGSGSVSSYAVGFDGSLRLLNSAAANTGSQSSPVDAAISNDSRFLYVLTPGTNNVQGFSIGLDGSLTPLSLVATVLPASSGLVAR